MSYGITAQGFVLKPLSQILTELQDAAKVAYGNQVDVTPESVLGMLLGILAERESEQWELQQANYAAKYPDSATGASLDDLGALTGTPRLAAIHSKVTLTLTGTAGTFIPNGTQFEVVQTGTKFGTTIATVIGVGGTVDVAAEALDTGPLIAPAGTVTVIGTPVAGLSAVTNAQDAQIGANIETDADYRVRRAAELQAVGGSTLGALRSDTLTTLGVIEARVYENDDVVTDVDGRPAKSVEVVVRGGTDADVAASILKSKAAGVQAYGTTIVAVTDTEGTSHNIGLTRPTDVDIYLTISVRKVSDPTLPQYPIDGDTQIKEALAAYAQANLGIGDTVVYSALFPPIFSVPGIKDVTSLYVGTTASPTGTTNVAIGIRQIANIDTSRITVTSTT